MAQVTVKINGYAYTVGCDDGQEKHLLAMAGQVERRIDSVKGVAGQSGEARLLALAALLMADELHDLHLGETRAKPGLLSEAPLASDPRVEVLASRAEAIAEALEHP